MNKQELIEVVEELPANCRGLRPMIDKWSMLELIKLLDEPQPVKVPQFMADWITHSKNIGCSLFGAMSIFEENFEIKKLMQWAENQEIFARAWLNGYEVEEEKRYIVSLNNGQPLTETQSGKVLYFNQNIITGNYKFTRKELEEAGFGWVFDCPGIEIEEVEYDTNA